MNDLRIRVCVAPLLFLAICAHGCKKSSGAVPVHGHVAFQGQPLASASVTFFPVTGRPVGAPISQGEYKTELMPGEYTAVVAVAPEIPKGFKEGDPLPPPKFVLPDEYTVRTKSALKPTVKPDQKDPIDFDLK